jgi:hypothetical protein
MGSGRQLFYMKNRWDNFQSVSTKNTAFALGRFGNDPM